MRLRPLVLLLFAPAVAAAEPAIMVSDAFARAGSPLAQVGVAYMTLTNAGADDRLIGAHSAVAERVELHTHIAEGGMMRMRKVDYIALPDRAETVLAPGGLHVMLIGLTQPLRAGETLSLTLDFAHAPDQVIAVPILAPGAMRHDHSDPHHGQGHSH